MAMRMRGLEPPRGCPHTDLNRARLPIPPHPRGKRDSVAPGLARTETGAASAARAIVPFLDDGEIFEVSLDARGEIVRFPLAANDRQPLLLLLPRTGLPRVHAHLLREPRPLGPDEERQGGGDEHDREDVHATILKDLKPGILAPDDGVMVSGPFVLVLIALSWATIFRAVLVFADKLPPTCPRCWRRFERRY